MSTDNDLLSAEPLDEEAVAARYGVTTRSVRRWRAKRTGPRFFYAGRSVRYRLADLVDWEEAAVMKAAS